MRRALAAAALALAGTGCTSAQMRAFIEWHEADPAGASSWAESPAAQQFMDDSDGPQFHDYLVAGSRYGLAVWDRIAWCESGGDWSHGPVTNGSGTYSGGVMIGHRWWPKFRGTEFAAYPYLATKAEQIVVAERIADAVGLDAGWMCYP